MWFNQIIQALEVNGKIPSKRCNYQFLRRTFESEPRILSLLDIYEYDGYSVRELFTLAKMGLEAPGICIICQTSRKMFVFGDSGISDYCQKECSSKDIARIQRAVKTRDANPGVVAARKEARKKTMLEKYGVEFNSQRMDLKHIWQKSKLQNRIEALVGDRDWLYNQYIILDKTYADISAEYNIDKGTIQKYIAIHEIPVKTGYSISSGQRQVASFIEQLGFIVEHNAKIFSADKREIDIYVRDKKFGIEYDGLYYHGSDTKLSQIEKRIHQKKVIDAHDIGSFIIRITEEEWKESPELIKSIIRSKLGVTERIYARNCVIKYVSAPEARQYLQKNHLSGYSVSKINIGLFYQNELVSICTFGKPRFEKKYDWELIRFASNLNTTVVGGFQKILKFFRSEHSGSLVTYADRRISNGSVYLKAGFSFLKLTEPGYVWTDGSRTYTRYKTQKSKLQTLLKIYDSNLTEEQNMFANKYKIYYDCGNLKFVLE